MFVKLDGLARLAQVQVGIAQIAERIAFASSVADFAGDGNALFVKLDGLARLTQSGVGQTQIAERNAFILSPFQTPSGGKLHFQPANPFARMLAQAEHVNSGVGVFNAQFRSGGNCIAAAGCPSLSGFDVRAFAVKERHSFDDLLSALQVKIVGFGQHSAKMLRVVQLQIFAVVFAELRVGKDARQIVQPVPAFRFVKDDQIAAQQFAQAFVFGVLANRFFRRSVERSREDRQAAKDSRRFLRQPRVTQIERRLDADFVAFGVGVFQFQPFAFVAQFRRVFRRFEVGRYIQQTRRRAHGQRQISAQVTDLIGNGFSHTRSDFPQQFAGFVGREFFQPNALHFRQADGFARSHQQRASAGNQKRADLVSVGGVIEQHQNSLTGQTVAVQFGQRRQILG